LILAIALVLGAQDVLTNDSIVKMVKSGLGESLVINMVESQPGKYTLTPDELVKLKEAGVTEKIMSVMIGKMSGNVGSPSGAAKNEAAVPSDPDLPQGIEVGAYFKKAGKWEELLPEVVNWKTGGVLKHVATVGVVKGDVNGRIQGPHSRNSITSPLEIVIYTPEGVAITEYQFLRLREKDDAREFRTVTGGVLHVSGGATRDVLPFEGKKVGNRLYKVVLPRLEAGEYGFLPPGAVGSASSASIGKLYSLRVVE
jgi:hypothetical protein